MSRLYEYFVTVFRVRFPIATLDERAAFRKGWNEAMRYVSKPEYYVEAEVWQEPNEKV